MALRGKKEKIRFVKELVGSVQQSIIALINEGKVPEEWDGHELRHLIADRFKSNTTKLALKRRREYNNTVLVENLV